MNLDLRAEVMHFYHERMRNQDIARKLGVDLDYVNRTVNKMVEQEEKERQAVPAYRGKHARV